MFERIFAAAWNRLATAGKSKPAEYPSLDLGSLVSDGEIQRARGFLPHSKRAEHVAILGKTGQGKSFFLRHLSSQDVLARRGFVFFDLHGDTMPFLLRLIAAEERRRGEDLSQRLIVIEPADTEYSIGLNVLESRDGQTTYAQLAEFAQIRETVDGLTETVHSHAQEIKTQTDEIRTGMSRLTRSVPTLFEPRRPKAGASGIEPDSVVLEAARLPETHSRT